MKYFSTIFLLCCSFLQAGVQQEDYSFDLSEIKKKPFEVSGYLEARPIFSWLDQNSPFTLIRSAGGNSEEMISEYNFKAILDTTLEKGITKAFARLNVDLNHSDPGWSVQTSLYEGYLSLKPSRHVQIDIGKKRLKWGKGYAWNPVAFIDNPKNPNEPDLALEGFTVVSFDFIKSFKGKLRTMGLTAVILPVLNNMNSQAGRFNTVNFGGKLYLLLFDTDIDFMFLTGPGVPLSLGIDFSRNLGSNLEIHGEWSYCDGFFKTVLTGEATATRKEAYGHSFLLGLRYLTEFNTTFFLEYYRNAKGYTEQEMDEYYSAVQNAYSLFINTGDDHDLNQVSGLSGYRTFTPMTDYLYLRVSQKEPFDILYFTPSLTSIFNFRDSSLSLASELLYLPVTNLELLGRAMLLLGRRGTEFGEKQNNLKIDLRIRLYF